MHILWPTGPLRWLEQHLIAIFSMVPIIIIIVAVFGLVAGDEAISEKLFEELSLLVGQENSSVLEEAIKNYQLSENSLTGTIIGVAFFWFWQQPFLVPCKVPSVFFVLQIP